MRKSKQDKDRLVNIATYMPELTDLIDHCPVFESNDIDLAPEDFLYVDDVGYSLIKLNSFNYPALATMKHFDRKYFLNDPVRVSAVLVTKKYKERRPCLILSHGSGGNTASEWQVAQKMMHKYDLNVLILDHYTQRNIENTIANQFLISIESQMIDIAESSKFLQKLNFVNKEKLLVAGVSRGGTVVDRLRRKRVLKTLNIDPFAAYVCFYPLPHAQESNPSVAESPALYIVGDQDDITPLSVLKPYLDRLKSFGYDSDLHVAEGAFHAFEYPGNWKLGVLNKFYKPTKYHFINKLVHKLAEKIFIPMGVTPLHMLQILKQSCYLHDETGFLPLDKDCTIPKGMNPDGPKKPFSQLVEYVRSNITYGGRVQRSGDDVKEKAYKALYNFLDKVLK